MTVTNTPNVDVTNPPTVHVTNPPTVNATITNAAVPVSVTNMPEVSVNNTTPFQSLEEALGCEREDQTAREVLGAAGDGTLAVEYGDAGVETPSPACDNSLV